ncbi:hypothetical protein HanLR1_Chr03g0077121 [Helianthus annuus]|nr:hypothetical protein HanHA89_Chr03g0083591 [Helianthus annuus]KAJ0766396.1 hypothetical protein HanLR1_Chr03g0077121 [Helianthus annuus]
MDKGCNVLLLAKPLICCWLLLLLMLGPRWRKLLQGSDKLVPLVRFVGVRVRRGLKT